MDNKEQLFRVIKWVLRFLLYTMIVVVIYDYTQRDYITLDGDITILIHVLLTGIIMYALVHHREM